MIDNFNSQRGELKQPRLRICLFSSQSSWHGGERQMQVLASGLQRRGHDVLAMVRSGSEVEKRMRLVGLPTYGIAGRGRSPRSLWAIRRQLRSFHPDALFYNDSHALIVGGVAACRMPIPAKILARRVAFPLRSTRHVKWFSDRVVCVSSVVREICAQSGLPKQNLVTIHDGVDPQSLQPNRANVAKLRKAWGERPVLLTVAKLADCKGHRYMVSAMTDLIRGIPDALWVLAGEGPMRSAIEQQVAELGLHDHVQLLGYRDDTADLIAAADVMVMPSHTEGLCSSIIDAMLLSCPVVASRAGGIPDLLVEGCYPLGHLVEPRHPQELAKAILSTLQTPETSRLQARAARESALRRFTADVMVDQTLGLIQELVTQRPTVRGPYGDSDDAKKPARRVA